MSRMSNVEVATPGYTIAFAGKDGDEFVWLDGESLAQMADDLEYDETKYKNFSEMDKAKIGYAIAQLLTSSKTHAVVIMNGRRPVVIPFDDQEDVEIALATHYEHDQIPHVQKESASVLARIGLLVAQRYEQANHTRRPGNRLDE